MTILLTNDDGLGAPGLEALRNELIPHHDVWVVAPESEMSGRSHGITLHEGLKVHSEGSQCFAVRGTPVDCVNLALSALMPLAPDLVISGINKGPNLGTDILYSGTCAAAREAVIRGVCGIAVSLATQAAPWDYGDAAKFVSQGIAHWSQDWDSHCFWNINVPDSKGALEVRQTVPGTRKYHNEMVCFRSPRGGEYWFLQPASIESSDKEGTDTRAIQDGCISIGQVLVEPVAPGNGT
ncbi:MAG: 5'/3'-nucleotidase SurE [Spirochaetales bacterium]|nr:5'/3'-nucleotidase SurE [Spirochaetales bacterium]